VAALSAYESEKVGRRTMLGQKDLQGAFKNQGRGGGLTVNGTVAEQTQNYIAHAVRHSQSLAVAEQRHPGMQAGSLHHHRVSAGTLGSNASRLALSRPHASIQQELQQVERSFAAGANRTRGGKTGSVTQRSFNEIRAQQKYHAGHAVSMLGGGAASSARTGNDKVDNIRRIRASHALSIAGALGVAGHGHMQGLSNAEELTAATQQLLADVGQTSPVVSTSLNSLFSKQPKRW
jgi:hypothetical protein